MQAIQLLRKMMEGMRLRFAHHAAGSIPLHFVVNVKKCVVHSRLTHTLVGTKKAQHTSHICCAKGFHIFGFIWCTLWGRVDSGLLGAFS